VDGELLRLARGFARAWLEWEAGRRAHRQLAGRAVRRAPARAGGVGVVERVWGVRTAADRFDVVAVVRHGDRRGALAFRLVCRRGGWTVVAAGRPEDQVDRSTGPGPVGPELVHPALGR